jgi:hypothetical protein
MTEQQSTNSALEKKPKKPIFLVLCLLLICATVCSAVLVFQLPFKGASIAACRGISNIGRRYVTLTPPPERITIQTNTNGSDQVLATTNDGKVICRFTSFGRPLEDVWTYWSPDKSKVI